jgi:arginine-tRNA-protein transferase
MPGVLGPVQQFRPSRSLRRVTRRNSDLRVVAAPPRATGEKFELFRRYLDAQHDGTMGRTPETFSGFLYDSPTSTLEFTYFLGERLVGVSLADRCPGGLSSVYMFFEPECADRSLGTYSVLWEIEYCRQERLAYYYLGYFVAGCSKMAYKSRFHPCQILVGDDRWVAFRE